MSRYAESEFASLKYFVDDLAAPDGRICKKPIQPKVPVEGKDLTDLEDQFSYECASLQSYARYLHKYESPQKEEYQELVEPPLPPRVSKQLEELLDLAGAAFV